MRLFRRTRDTRSLKWQRTRRQVLNRDRRKCRVCGRSDRGLHVHHKEEWARGGSDRVGNLITLCRQHHARQHPRQQRLILSGGQRRQRPMGSLVGLFAIPFLPILIPLAAAIKILGLLDAITRQNKNV